MTKYLERLYLCNNKLNRLTFMLLQIAVQNFKSFKELTVFNFISGNNLPENMPTHAMHLLPTPDNGVKVLKGAAIFGANASGKTSFYEVFEFLHNLLTLDENPFSASLINKKSTAYHAGIQLMFIVNNIYYNYSLVFKDGKILEEWLYTKTSLDSDWDRIAGREYREPVNKYSSPRYSYYIDNSLYASASAPFSYDFIFENDLYLIKKWHGSFLKCLGMIGVTPFDSVYNYLKTMCCINARASLFNSPLVAKLLIENSDFRQFCVNFFKDADFGITDITVTTEKASDRVERSNVIRQEVYNKGIYLLAQYGVYITKGNDGVYYEHKLNFFHRGIDTPFSLGEESGSVYRLLPILYSVFLNCSSFSSLAIIDDLDKGLHPNLVKELVRFFLTNAKGQFIFTTHCSNLLDTDLLRIDEVYLLDKKSYTEVSTLYQYRKTVREVNEKSYSLQNTYLQGRFGGVPYITKFDTLTNYETEE